jgi:hypothetical protein
MPCRLALLAFLLASTLRASETPESLVQKKLLAPLVAREKARSSYSRARPPAAERRVRMLDAAPIADAKGGAFVGFAVDARYGLGEGRWEDDVITGCVYAGTGEVYVRYGVDFRAAGVLLGKKTPPAASHVCRAAGAHAVVAGG